MKKSATFSGFFNVSRTNSQTKTSRNSDPINNSSKARIATIKRRANNLRKSLSSTIAGKKNRHNEDKANEPICEEFKILLQANAISRSESMQRRQRISVEEQSVFVNLDASDSLSHLECDGENCGECGSKLSSSSEGLDKSKNCSRRASKQTDEIQEEEDFPPEDHEAQAKPTSSLVLKSSSSPDLQELDHLQHPGQQDLLQQPSASAITEEQRRAGGLRYLLTPSKKRDHGMRKFANGVSKCQDCIRLIVQ